MQLLGASEPLKLDESSLTGESLSVKKGAGEIALSGSIVEYGVMNAKVVAIGSKTFFGKTLLLLGTQEKDTHLQKVLRRASVLLGIIGMLGASAIFGVLTGRGDHGVEFALVTAFVVLISTVPIAMPVVVGAVSEQSMESSFRYYDMKSSIHIHHNFNIYYYGLK